MADILQQLEDLNTGYNWLSGAGEVYDATKTVMDTAKIVEKMGKDARKGGKGATIDVRKLEKLLGADAKELTALNKHWTEQTDALEKAATAPWPAIKNDTRERYRKVMDIEAAEGAESPAFAKALKDTIACIEDYKTRLRERGSYASMVNEKMNKMHDAYMDGNEAIDDIFTMLEVALVAFGAASASAAATALKHMINIQRTIKNRPKLVAKAYRKLADNAKAHEVWTDKELAEVEKALKRLYGMQGEKVLRDVKDYLSGLFSAA